MTKKWTRRLLWLGLVSLLIIPSLAMAQSGVFTSIRGIVREDKDGNGKCDDGAIVPNVPIEFTSNDGQWTHVLYTGSDGTYGLVSVGYGTWTVQAKPAAEWVVTSAKTLNPFIGEEQPIALNVNFCVRKTSAVAGGGSTILPQSGAAAPTGIIVSVITGVMFVAVGVGLEGRRRWLDVSQR